MELRAILQRLLEARGWTQDELADKLDTSQNNVSRWLAGREPRGAVRELILKLAGDAGVVEDDAPTPRSDHTLPIMGYVGAGATVEPDYEQVPVDGLEQIELPYPIPGELIGFWVRGDSQLPKYDDGEVLLVAREQPSSVERMIGSMAVVRTDDGRRLVKRIMPGPKPHTFNLESINAKTIVGASIAWASPVRMIIPNIELRRTGAKPPAKAKRVERKR